MTPMTPSALTARKLVLFGVLIAAVWILIAGSKSAELPFEGDSASPADVLESAVAAPTGVSDAEVAAAQERFVHGAPPALVAAKFETERSELDRLARCFLSEDCGFSSSHPAGYHVQVTAAIQRELRLLAAQPKHREAAEQAARDFLLFPDDDVKAASLEVLARAEPTVENRNAIVAGLRDSVSAPLYETGLEILQAYQDVEGREIVDAFLLEAIRRGGHFVSAEVARRSLPFLSEDNTKAFRSLLQELPTRSRAREYLDLNLREYGRMRRGG